MKNFTVFSLDGFPSGVTDFGAVLATDATKNADFIDRIVDPIAAAVNSSDQAAALVVRGHSDRVDDPALDREERRQKELDASKRRADSVIGHLVSLLAAKMNNGEDPTDPTWDSPRLHIFSIASGAAQLKVSDSVLSEADRLQNRRVSMGLVIFKP